MEQHEIIIVGSGLVGSAAAIGLAQAGFQVALLEAAPEARASAALIGRSYALSASSVKLLSRLGLGRVLEDHAAKIGDVLIRDHLPGEKHSTAKLRFDPHEIGLEPLGAVIEDEDLRAGLHSALMQVGVRRYFDARVCQASSSSVAGKLTLQNGAELAGRLIIAADGRESALRRFVRIRRIKHDYDQASISLIIHHENEHEGIAEQVFLPGGPLAALPLQGKRCNIVWSDRIEAAKALSSLDQRALASALEDRLGARLGRFETETSAVMTPLALSLSSSFISERFALIGDAARAVHPIAGQGMNAGLHDVAALVQALTEARRSGEEAGNAEALRAYQEARRFNSASLAFSTDALLRLFRADHPITRNFRAHGINFIEQSREIRRLLMRTAAGKIGDLPELMR